MLSKKPFLILQLRPEDITSDNEFDSILKYAELTPDEVQRIRIEETGIPEISLDDYSAIIVGGSPFDISTASEDKSEIQKKIEADFKLLFDKILAIDFPFLGACSGNGLLGSYLGTRISRKYPEPVSCPTIQLTKEGSLDPLLSGFPDRIPVLLGHKEACDTVPEGATLLMRGDACPVQMFRVKNNIYATQFHPEGDAEGFILRIDVYKDHGYFKPEKANELIEDLKDKKTPHSQEILKRFAQRYKVSKLTPDI